MGDANDRVTLFLICHPERSNLFREAKQLRSRRVPGPHRNCPNSQGTRLVRNPYLRIES
jgi:hypothetical protein